MPPKKRTARKSATKKATASAPAVPDVAQEATPPPTLSAQPSTSSAQKAIKRRNQAELLHDEAFVPLEKKNRTSDKEKPDYRDQKPRPSAKSGSNGSK
ncbi:unnamed protein product [Caenorhabditis sp. 36 PRJEB53466]|nr:unnamed protein product [Caenorhabditis sp. 36 PRJEB53466]